MKLTTSHVVVAFLSVTLGSTVASSAPIEAKIPFEFRIGDKTLPPAEYLVETASDTGPSVLRIRAKDTGERTMFDTDQLSEKQDPKAIELVFEKVGDKTYLMEVWGVTDSGRGVKHIVDGQLLKRATDASRERITAIRIVDGT